MGILVVNRMEWLRGGDPVHPAAVDASPADVFRRYRGFDGEVWPRRETIAFPLEEGLARLDDVALVDEYLAAFPDVERSECEVIVVDQNSASELVAVHSSLQANGADLEEGQMSPIAILVRAKEPAP